jgi:hypothetical protein
LPTDEQEEKAIDIQEVTAQVMSRKSYMKKWRGLTDEEVQEELEQIALERQMLEDTFSDMTGSLNDGEIGASDFNTDINTDNNTNSDSDTTAQNVDNSLEDAEV